jgi:phytoene dehydrogenase-like protein
VANRQVSSPLFHCDPRPTTMCDMEGYDAVVVGSGPNGLSAAVTLAQAGRSVLVVEAADSIGGGTRTEELTLPGFRHDVCSAIHPLALGSPYLRTLPLAEHGLRWAQPTSPLAHAITPERVATLPGDVEEAVEALGSGYGRVMRRMLEAWPDIEQHILGPVARIPRHPISMARFGIEALQPATVAARRFDESGAALFAGCAAHAFLPLSHPLTASFGWLLMATAHLYGWPAAVGGSQAITEAMASLLRSMGGEIRTGWKVERLAELPPHSITMLDLAPSGLARLAGEGLPARYLRRVRGFRHGPAAYKIDYALDGPVPWTNPALADAGTVHLSGTLEQVAEAEEAAYRGQVHPRPFILVAQQSTFDPTRAPAGKHTLWVYAHVANGSTVDHTVAIERRLEEFAPGFGDLVLARHVIDPAGFESRNPNYVGGDIAGGAHTLGQLVFRPFPQTNPYATPLPGVYLCSSSTPPGAGTHGMCGHHAAMTALSTS